MTAPAERACAHQFLWLDLETTGLDPRVDSVIELALILADDDPAGECTFEPVDTFSTVIKLQHGITDEFVRNMHTRSGLLAEATQSDVTTRDVDAFLVEVCEGLGAKARGCTLAGFSVHFDLGFCRVHLPRFAQYLSHRVFDVSTLKTFARTYGPPAGFPLEGIRAHRAEADVLESLAAARAYRDAIEDLRDRSARLAGLEE